MQQRQIRRGLHFKKPSNYSAQTSNPTRGEFSPAYLMKYIPVFHPSGRLRVQICSRQICRRFWREKFPKCAHILYAFTGTFAGRATD
jgi:hypothetical protein